MSYFRPTCINYGCFKPVAVMEGRITDFSPRWRVHCGHCQAASYGKWPHSPGVTPYKKDVCTNIDGHLGFPCVVDWKLVKKSKLRLSTQVDHKNGNSSDNCLKNLQELCSICHSEKGKRNGDHNAWRTK